MGGLQRTPPQSMACDSDDTEPPVVRQTSLVQPSVIRNATLLNPPEDVSTLPQAQGMAIDTQVNQRPKSSKNKSRQLNINIADVNRVVTRGLSSLMTTSNEKIQSSNCISPSLSAEFSSAKYELKTAESISKRKRFDDNQYFGISHETELIFNDLSQKIDSLTYTITDNQKFMNELKNTVNKIAADNSLLLCELNKVKKMQTQCLKILNRSAAANPDAQPKQSTVDSNCDDIIQRRTAADNAVAQPKQATIIQRRTMADVLKNGSAKHVVVIKPNEMQDSKVTMEELKKNVSPTNKKISRVRNAANGGVVIECETVEALTELKRDADEKLGQQYNILIPQRKYPSVRVFGISEKYTPDEIAHKLRKQNPSMFTANSIITVSSVFSVANSNRCGFRMSTDPLSFANIMANKKLRVGWDLCQATEAVNIIRCYNCCAYGHFMKDCKSSIVCAKCASDHATRDCSADNENCANCLSHNKRLNLGLDTSHAALSVECPVYLRLLKQRRSRIDYDTMPVGEHSTVDQIASMDQPIVIDNNCAVEIADGSSIHS